MSLHHYSYRCLILCAVVLIGCNQGRLPTASELVEQGQEAFSNATSSEEKDATEPEAVASPGETAATSSPATETNQPEGDANKPPQAAIGRLTDAAKEAKKAFTGTADKVQENLQLAGNFQIQLGAPVRVNSCYATFSILPGRPATLCLRSAKDPSSESFPSALLVARFETDSLATLAGKTAEGSLFFAGAGAADVWTSDKPLQIEITSVDAKQITGQIRGGQLRHIASDRTLDPSGSFVGVFETGGASQ